MNDTENDKSPSQWLLKIIGGIEILIAGLLSLSFLSMLFGVILKFGEYVGEWLIRKLSFIL